VNLGHRAWWYRGHFCNLEKKLFPKEIFFLKRGKTWGWVKNAQNFQIEKILRVRKNITTFKMRNYVYV